MLDQHSSLGIAEIVFYVPVFVLALYFFAIRHGRPRMVWWFLLMFSCFRIASGIISILYQRDRSNVGLLIAAIITLNVGVIPLLLCTIGFIRVIAVLDYSESQSLRKSILLVRAGFGLGILLLVAGGVLEGRYDQPSLPPVGLSLTKAGYIIIACTLLGLILFEAFFWGHRAALGKTSRSCLTAISIAMPFQFIRIIYALLTIWTPSGSKWNALSGSIGAFIGMALVMEYIVVVMYITTGIIIEPVRVKLHVADSLISKKLSTQSVEIKAATHKEGCVLWNHGRKRLAC